MDTSSLEKLISSAQAGETGSFEELHRRLVGPVFAFVAHRTSTRDDAKMVTQDSLAEVFLALSRFEYQSDGAFHAFVYTITRRQLAKYYETARKHTTEVVTEQFADEAEDGDDERSLRAALLTLDEVAREIVVLHHWSRYTFGEIAGMLKMTEEAVRVRHHRAKATLKSIITR